jgi:hypothetical protein
MDEYLDAADGSPIQGFSALHSPHGARLPPLDLSAMAYIYFTHPLLSSFVLTRWLNTLLEHITESTDKSKILHILAIRFLSAVGDIALRNLEYDLSHFVSLTACLVKLWIESSRWPFSLSCDDFVESLENVLLSLLRTKTFGSSVVQAALAGYSDEMVVSRCLERAKGKRASQGCLLSALVETRGSRFGYELLRQLSGLVSLNDVFDAGYFDNAFLLLLERGIELNTNPQTLVVWKDELIEESCEAIDNLSETMLESRTVSTFRSLARLLKTKQVGQSHMASLSKALAGCISNFICFEWQTKVSVQILECLVECAVGLYGMSPEGKTQDGARFSANLLFLLCEIAPQALRLHAGKYTAGDVSSVLSAEQVLVWTLEVVLDRIQIAKDCMGASGVKKIYSMIRACLRFGLSMNESQDTLTMSLCVRVVKSFVAAASGGSPTLTSLFASKPLAAQVFDMVVSHSRFRSIREDASSKRDNVEAIHLLMFCISRTSEVKFDYGVLEALLQSYHAGVGESDLELRRLVAAYCEVAISVG